MAPETIFLKEQDFRIDYYSLGIICYEFIIGNRPYEGNSRNEVKQILSEYNIEIQKDENISELYQNLINGLLTKNPEDRLVSQSGASEIKENLFFKGFNWENLKRKKYISPLFEMISFSKSKNTADELFDQEFCNKTEEIDENTKIRYSQIMNHENYPDYFRQYTYICKDAVNNIIINRENGMSAPPKKSLNYSRSTGNINLPRLKSGSQKSISISNGGNYKIKNHDDYNYPQRKKRISSIGSNDNSLKDYYQYKLNKYKKLLQKVNHMDYYPNSYNNYNNDYPLPPPNYNYNPPPQNYNNNYYPPPGRNIMNGDDIYNEVYNGLQRKLYRDIFGDLNGDPLRRVRNGMPNQYQINNYYPPPPYMTPGMGMPPYYFMMNPYLNKKGDFFLPNIYDKDRHRHKHKHKSDKNSYSKSSYTKTSSKYYKSSKKLDKSSTVHSKKKKKSKKDEDEDEEDEKESSEENTKKSKKKKKSSNGDESENEEDEDDEEDTKKSKKKKKSSNDDEDEDNEEKEDEDEEKEEEDNDEEKEDEEKDDKESDEEKDDEDKDEDEDKDSDGDKDSDD